MEEIMKTVEKIWGNIPKSRKLNFPEIRLQLNVKNKLILSFLAILIIPSISVGLLYFEAAKNKIDEKMLHSTIENIKLLNGTINVMVGPKIKDTAYFSQKYNYDSFKVENIPNVEQQLSQYMVVHSDVLRAYFATNEGNIILPPNTSFPSGLDPRKREWYQEAFKQNGQTIITSPYVDVSTGHYIITIAKVIKDGTSVFAIDVNMKPIMDFIKEVKIGKVGYIVTFDKDRKFVYHPTLQIGSEVPKFVWLDNLYKSDSGSFEYEFENQRKEMSFLTNSLTGWRIAGTFYSSEVANDAQSIFQRMIFVISIAFILGGGLIYFIIKSIDGRLKTLIDASGEISQGDLTKRLDIKNKDELDQLGNSFNQMRDSLHYLILEIKEKIRITHFFC